MFVCVPNGYGEMWIETKQIFFEFLESGGLEWRV